MSGIFSVLSDSRAGMFRLQQAKKAWERDMEAMDAKDAKTLLSEKADKARPSSNLSARQQDHASALTAMEEAKRIGSSKASAAQKLDEIERKIEQLKLMMRHAGGDREKLAQLAREAAILARQAGRAAKEYGGAIAAEAESGRSGTLSLNGATTERTTTLTVMQTEVSVQVTISLGDGGDAGGSGAGGGSAVPVPTAPPPVAAMTAGVPETGSTESELAESELAGTGSADADFAELVNAAVAGLQGAGQPMLASARGDKARELMQRMLAENELKMARYKEADGFGKRVEKVLATAKTIIGEAKAANMLEESEERRKARRKTFEEYDKMLEESQQEVNDLRKAAFGSSISTEDFLDALADPTLTDPMLADAAMAEADGGGEGGAAFTAGPALSGAQTAVNLLA